jgi:hypothetical protein
LTPAEQIRRFVERHPGEWRRIDRRNYDDAHALKTAAGWLVLRPFIGFVSVTASRRGPDEADFCADDDEQTAPILTQAAARTAEVCQAYNVPVEGLPPWLRDPVRRILRARAGELLTLAGSSPADVMSAAETLDEHLLTRQPVEATFSGVVNALLASGMSCRWVKDPAEPVEMT